MRSYISTIALLAFVLISSSLFSQVQPPSPYFPRQGVVTQNTVTIKWNSVPTALSYDVEYANNAAFTSSTTISAVATTSTTLPTLTSGRYYYWRVRANTPAGTSSWSTTYNFLLFTPTDIPNLAFWVSADGPSTVDVANRVSQWTDRSGQGNHITQANPTKQPLLVDNSFNGKPTIKFDGGDVLSGGDILDVSNTSRTSVVFGRSNTNTGCYFAKSIAGAPGNRYGLLYSNPKLYYIYHDSGYKEISPNRLGGAKEVIMTVADRTSLVLNMRVNGFNFGTPASGIRDLSYNMNSTFRFLVGAYNDASDAGEILYLNGDIAEMFFYNGSYPDSVRQVLEKYVMDKYYPPVSLGADTIIAYGFCPVTLNAGSGFVTYSWSGGGSSATKQATQPGNYSVTVTDEFGRVSADTIKVIMPDPNFNGIASFCLNDSTEWNTDLGSPAYTYAWSNGKTTPSIFVSTAGTYSVTITDTSGCSLTSQSTTFNTDLFENNVSIISSPDTALCSGNTLGLSTGGNLVNTYQWSTSAVTPTISVDTSGTYTLTVTNSIGCIANLAATVNIIGTGPTVDFNFDTACAGSPTTFTDLSTIPNPLVIGSWQWAFGDGNNSTDQNPTHTYSNPGVYNVTLTASSQGGCASTPLTKQVIVYPSITAQFNDTVACLNSNSLFFDNSTYSSPDSINAWYWDFDNNDTSTDKDPQTTFSSVGTYTVSLSVSSVLGCADTVTKNVTVGTSFPAPQAFTPLSPQPNNVNISTSDVTFEWQRSLNAVRYRIEVATNTNFLVTIVSANTTALSYTTASIPFSSSPFYYRVTAYNVCGDAISTQTFTFYHFSPSVLQSNMALWVMADGNLSKNGSDFVSQWSDQSPMGNNLSQAGSGLQPKWVDSIALLRDKPVLRFDGSDFLNGGNALSLEGSSWNFFVVGKMNNINNTYFSKSTASADPNRYALLRGSTGLNMLLHDAIVFEAKLVTILGQYELVHSRINRPLGVLELNRNSVLLAQTGGLVNPYNNVSTTRFLVGAYSNATNNDQLLYLDGDIAEIIAIDTNITTLQKEAIERYLYNKYSQPLWLGPDIKLDYGFCDSVVLDATERYVSYLWSTGDTTSKLRVNVSGNYSATVTDVFGRVYVDDVNVQLPSVSLPTTNEICIGDSVVWDAYIAPGYNYLWNTSSNDPEIVINNPGSYYVVVSDTNSPLCTYTSDTFVVQLDSFVITTTLGPDDTLCGGAELGLLTNTSQVIAYQWSTQEVSPTILLDTAGTYRVSVTNVNGCVAADTISITLSGQLADVDFTIDPTSCLGDTSFFNDLSTVQAPYNILEQVWTYGDNSPNDTTTNGTNLYASGGAYNVTLSVETDSNCIATATKTLVVFEKPVAGFSYEIGCAGIPFIFRDRSTSPSNDPITQYSWDFGDNSTASIKNPTHIYATHGEYYVSLTVTSTAGCSSTFTDTITVYPELQAEVGADNLCFGQTVQFYDAGPSFSISSYFWEFGDGDFSFDETPTHNYAQEGTKVVRLTVTNALGCELTVTDTIFISESPVAAVENSEACEGLPMQFTDITNISGQDSIVTWLWDFGDSTFISRLPAPLHVYDTAGTYTVTLNVTSINGCTDQVTQQVTVAPPPVADFTFDPEFGQSPLLVDFTNNSTGAVSYFWDFGDGDTSTQAEPIHTYQNDGTYTITLTVTGIGGCTSTITQQISVIVTTLNISVSLVEATDDNGRLYLSALIGNKGTRDVTSFEIMSTIGKGSRIAEHVDTLLPSGRSMFYRFKSSYLTTDAEGESYICLEAYLPNGEQDDDPSDNKQCVTLEDVLKIVPVYPNPASDFVTLDLILPADENIVIDLYDTYGHELLNTYNGMSSSGLNSFKVDIRALPAGVYIFQIKYQDERYVEKFVIEK